MAKKERVNFNIFSTNNKIMEPNRKTHWEQVYQTKTPNQVSWTQEKPKIALEIIRSFGLPKTAKIIDVGGGDSTLVDYLLLEGYENITVLDISAKALEKAQNRLGDQASKVTWIVSDITSLQPQSTYDIWHDRAAFHFLTTNEHIEKYWNIVNKVVSNFLIVGTFSEQGPTKCSGLEIRQYNKESLSKVFVQEFDRISCIEEEHLTPFDTLQHFLFCSFKRKKRTIQVQ